MAEFDGPELEAAFAYLEFVSVVGPGRLFLTGDAAYIVPPMQRAEL